MLRRPTGTSSPLRRTPTSSRSEAAAGNVHLRGAARPSALHPISLHGRPFRRFPTRVCSRHCPLSDPTPFPCDPPPPQLPHIALLSLCSASAATTLPDFYTSRQHAPPCPLPSFTNTTAALDTLTSYVCVSSHMHRPDMHMHRCCKSSSTQQSCGECSARTSSAAGCTHGGPVLRRLKWQPH